MTWRLNEAIGASSRASSTSSRRRAHPTAKEPSSSSGRSQTARSSKAKRPATVRSSHSPSDATILAAKLLNASCRSHFLKAKSRALMKFQRTEFQSRAEQSDAAASNFLTRSQASLQLVEDYKRIVKAQLDSSNKNLGLHKLRNAFLRSLRQKQAEVEMINENQNKLLMLERSEKDAIDQLSQLRTQLKETTRELAVLRYRSAGMMSFTVCKRLLDRKCSFRFQFWRQRAQSKRNDEVEMSVYEASTHSQVIASEVENAWRELSMEQQTSQQLRKKVLGYERRLYAERMMQSLRRLRALERHWAQQRRVMTLERWRGVAAVSSASHVQAATKLGAVYRSLTNASIKGRHMRMWMSFALADRFTVLQRAMHKDIERIYFGRSKARMKMVALLMRRWARDRMRFGYFKWQKQSHRRQLIYNRLRAAMRGAYLTGRHHVKSQTFEHWRLESVGQVARDVECERQLNVSIEREAELAQSMADREKSYEETLSRETLGKQNTFDKLVQAEKSLDTLQTAYNNLKDTKDAQIKDLSEEYEKKVFNLTKEKEEELAAKVGQLETQLNEKERELDTVKSGLAKGAEEVTLQLMKVQNAAHQEKEMMMIKHSNEKNLLQRSLISAHTYQRRLLAMQGLRQIASANAKLFMTRTAGAMHIWRRWYITSTRLDVAKSHFMSTIYAWMHARVGVPLRKWSLFCKMEKERETKNKNLFRRFVLHWTNHAMLSAFSKWKEYGAAQAINTRRLRSQFSNICRYWSHREYQIGLVAWRQFVVVDRIEEEFRKRQEETDKKHKEELEAQENELNSYRVNNFSKYVRRFAMQRLTKGFLKWKDFLESSREHEEKVKANFKKFASYFNNAELMGTFVRWKQFVHADKQYELNKEKLEAERQMNEIRVNNFDKYVKRFVLNNILKSFNKWRAFTEAMNSHIQKCRNNFKKFVSYWTNQELTTGIQRWKAFVIHDKRVKANFLKFSRYWTHQELSQGIQKWKEFVAYDAKVKDNFRKFCSLWSDNQVQVALSRWRGYVKNMKELDKTKKDVDFFNRVMRRFVVGRMEKSFDQWKEQTAFAAAHEKRCRDNFMKFCRYWTHQELNTGMVRWKEFVKHVRKVQDNFRRFCGLWSESKLAKMLAKWRGFTRFMREQENTSYRVSNFERHVKRFVETRLNKGWVTWQEFVRASRNNESRVRANFRRICNYYSDKDLTNALVKWQTWSKNEYHSRQNSVRVVGDFEKNLRRFFLRHYDRTITQWKMFVKGEKATTERKRVLLTRFASFWTNKEFAVRMSMWRAYVKYKEGLVMKFRRFCNYWINREYAVAIRRWKECIRHGEKVNATFKKICEHLSGKGILLHLHTWRDFVRVEREKERREREAAFVGKVLRALAHRRCIQPIQHWQGFAKAETARITRNRDKFLRLAVREELVMGFHRWVHFVRAFEVQRAELRLKMLRFSNFKQIAKSFLFGKLFQAFEVWRDYREVDLHNHKTFKRVFTGVVKFWTHTNLATALHKWKTNAGLRVAALTSFEHVCKLWIARERLGALNRWKAYTHAVLKEERSNKRVSNFESYVKRFAYHKVLEALRHWSLFALTRKTTEKTLRNNVFRFVRFLSIRSLTMVFRKWRAFAEYDLKVLHNFAKFCKWWSHKELAGVLLKWRQVIDDELVQFEHSKYEAAMSQLGSKKLISMAESLKRYLLLRKGLMMKVWVEYTVSARVLEAMHRQRILRTFSKFLNVCIRKHQSRAFANFRVATKWVAMLSKEQTISALKDQRLEDATERHRRTKAIVVGKVLRRLVHQRLSAAFARFVRHQSCARRLLTSARRIVQSLINGGMYARFVQWRLLALKATESANVSVLKAANADLANTVVLSRKSFDIEKCDALLRQRAQSGMLRILLHWKDVTAHMRAAEETQALVQRERADTDMAIDHCHQLVKEIHKVKVHEDHKRAGDRCHTLIHRVFIVSLNRSFYLWRAFLASSKLRDDVNVAIKGDSAVALAQILRRFLGVCMTKALVTWHKYCTEKRSEVEKRLHEERVSSIILHRQEEHEAVVAQLEHHVSLTHISKTADEEQLLNSLQALQNDRSHSKKLMATELLVGVWKRHSLKRKAKGWSTWRTVHSAQLVDDVRSDQLRSVSKGFSALHLRTVLQRLFFRKLSSAFSTWKDQSIANGLQEFCRSLDIRTVATRLFSEVKSRRRSVLASAVRMWKGSIHQEQSKAVIERHSHVMDERNRALSEEVRKYTHLLLFEKWRSRMLEARKTGEYEKSMAEAGALSKALSKSRRNVYLQKVALTGVRAGDFLVAFQRVQLVRAFQLWMRFNAVEAVTGHSREAERRSRVSIVENKWKGVVVAYAERHLASSLNLAIAAAIRDSKRSKKALLRKASALKRGSYAVATVRGTLQRLAAQNQLRAVSVWKQFTIQESAADNGHQLVSKASRDLIQAKTHHEAVLREALAKRDSLNKELATVRADYRLEQGRHEEDIAKLQSELTDVLKSKNGVIRQLEAQLSVQSQLTQQAEIECEEITAKNRQEKAGMMEEIRTLRNQLMKANLERERALEQSEREKSSLAETVNDLAIGMRHEMTERKGAYRDVVGVGDVSTHSTPGGGNNFFVPSVTPQTAQAEVVQDLKKAFAIERRSLEAGVSVAEERAAASEVRADAHALRTTIRLMSAFQRGGRGVPVKSTSARGGLASPKSAHTHSLPMQIEHLQNSMIADMKQLKQDATSEKELTKDSHKLQLDALKSERDLILSEVEHLRKQVSMLTTENRKALDRSEKQKEGEVASLRRQVDMALSAKEESGKLLAEEKRKNEEAVHLVEELRKEKSKLEWEVKVHESEGLGRVNEGLQKELQRWKGEYSRVEDELKSLESILRMKEKEKDQLVVDMNESSSRTSSEIKDMEVKLRLQYKDREAAMEETKRENDTLRAKVRTLQNEVVRLMAKR